MFVAPVSGRIVIRPDTQRPLAAGGEYVPDGDFFWLLRLYQGDVAQIVPGVTPTPIPPASVPPRASAVGLASTRTAGAAISGHRVLMFADGGAVVHADPSDPAYAFAGISAQASAMGAAVVVVEAGSIIEPSWNWTPRDVLFAGPGGTLTAIPPAAGMLHQVAVAMTPTGIFVRDYQPIMRN